MHLGKCGRLLLGAVAVYAPALPRRSILSEGVISAKPGALVKNLVFLSQLILFELASGVEWVMQDS